jgi:hypothetical protein
MIDGCSTLSILCCYHFVLPASGYYMPFSWILTLESRDALHFVIATHDHDHDLAS